MATSIWPSLRAGVVTRSAEETQSLAEQVAGELPADATLALHGDLGTGKTTFVQGLARGLGVEEAVTSPTFNLCRIYRVRLGGKEGGAREGTLAHVDAYRLESPAQAEALLLEEFLRSPYWLAVEWPGRIPGWIPADAWHFDFGLTAERQHTIRLRA